MISNQITELGYFDSLRLLGLCSYQHTFKLENYSSERRQHRCLRQASESIFGLVWPWPLTSWLPKLAVSWPCSVADLCQMASKLVYPFSYIMFTFSRNFHG